MKELCFCGRSGEIEDREPILYAESRWALRCPECGRVDYLHWLSEEEAFVLWGEARFRRENAPGEQHAA